MRSTITLEDDVAAHLREEMRRTGQSFKAVVNEYLRLGLAAKRSIRPESRFIVEPTPMGLRPGLSYDDSSELLEVAEGRRHR